ncbi:energy transducer TonB [Mucilaginibacter sp. AW1-3]
MRSPSETLAAETVRVLQLSPKWEPGIQKGKAVRVKFTVPVNYSIGKN